MSSLRRLLGAGTVLGAGGATYLLAGSTVAEARDIVPHAVGVPLHAQVPSRAEQVSKLQQGTAANPFDILIVGGGATGTGCAVDATTRYVALPPPCHTLLLDAPPA